MRLFDLIAQRQTDVIQTGDGRTLPNAEQFEQALRICPVRLILSDELVCSATQLAFGDGDRLTSCMDLLHVPARSIWVEWLEAPRRAELFRVTTLGLTADSNAHRGGALITAAPDCRSGHMRIFWSSASHLAYCSPVIVRFDLDNAPEPDAGMEPVIGQGWATVIAPPDVGLDDFLHHLHFHFDPDWSAYYRETCDTPELREAVLRHNLGACAFDPPMLFAFFLMLSAKGALQQRAVDMTRLNRSRTRAGRVPLLDHIEVSGPLYRSTLTGEDPISDESGRRSPRLHHVCGHMVRRGSSVFWRTPHLRGSARLGHVRSRTVTLQFPERASRAPRDSLRSTH